MIFYGLHKKVFPFLFAKIKINIRKMSRKLKEILKKWRKILINLLRLLLRDSKLSYRFRDSGIKVEFYKSGKIVIRGVRDERGINETVKKLSNYLFFKPFIYYSAG